MPILYDDLGGRPAIAAAVDRFYARVLDDPALAPYFDGRDFARLVHHQRRFLTLALGGPARYTGQTMRAAHAGLGVTDEAFDRVAGHLAATLEELGVPVPAIAAVIEGVAPLRAEIVEVAAPTDVEAGSAQ